MAHVTYLTCSLPTYRYLTCQCTCRRYCWRSRCYLCNLSLQLRNLKIEVAMLGLKLRKLVLKLRLQFLAPFPPKACSDSVASISITVQTCRILSDLVAEHRSRIWCCGDFAVDLATSSLNVCSDTVAWALVFVLPPLSLRLGRPT